MDAVRAIGKLGFKRWYERTLLKAHAWLVTCLLCALCLALALEDLSFRRPLADVAPVVGLLFVGGLICWQALWRFLVLMQEAQRFAERSSCPSCGVYAAFDPVEEFRERLRARCRRCGHEWLVG